MVYVTCHRRSGQSALLESVSPRLRRGKTHKNRVLLFDDGIIVEQNEIICIFGGIDHWKKEIAGKA